MISEDSKSGFPDTRWTLIQAVTNPNHPQHHNAMQSLAVAYWAPVYAYLRSQNFPREDACDIAQRFFADIILERNLFARADSSRGRLRNLILKSVTHFLAHVKEHAKAVKRNGHHQIPIHQMEREESMLANLGERNPEAAFDRRWALAVLQDALGDCERHYSQEGKRKHWEAFDARVLKPSLAMTPPRSYAEIAQTVGFSNADKAEEAVRVVKTRVDVRMRQIVAETADDDHEAEFQYLISLLS